MASNVNFMGFIDEDGNEILELDLPYVNIESEFHSGLAKLDTNDNNGFIFINKDNEVVIKEGVFRKLGWFEGGVAAFEEEPKHWGLIDINMNCIIKPQYESITYQRNVSNIFAIAIKENSYYLINSNNEMQVNLRRCFKIALK